MTFTPDEMRTALERMGYEIRREVIIERIRHNGWQEEERQHIVFNLYLNSRPMTEVGFEGHYGTRRIEIVFKEELKKRLLRLLEV